MLMVIFGAGATHGSIPDADAAAHEAEQPRPPVTNTLFLPRYAPVAERYPSSLPLIVQLRRAMTQDPAPLIEAEIGRLAEAAVDVAESARHFLSLRFYLSDVVQESAQWWWTALGGCTHYVELLARIGAWRIAKGEPVALVTLNYDRVLDRTVASQAGDWVLDGFDSYINRPDWRLYKLHGSTSWSRVVDTGPTGPSTRVAANIISAAAEIDVASGWLNPEPWTEPDRAGTPNTVAVPAIAVPTDRKIDFECPPEHVDAFRKDAAAVDRLLIIGWRAAEPHAIEALKAINPHYHLGIVDPNAQGVHDTLDRAVIRSGPAVHTIANRATRRRSWASFEDLLHGDTLEDWLNLPLPAPSPHDTTLLPYPPPAATSVELVTSASIEQELSGLVQVAAEMLVGRLELRADEVENWEKTAGVTVRLRCGPSWETRLYAAGQRQGPADALRSKIAFIDDELMPRVRDGWFTGGAH